MPTTTRSKLPYPAASDPADVPADMGKLATALDEIAYVEFTGVVAVPVNPATSAVVVVTAPAITFDGATPIVVEFFSPGVQAGVPGGVTDINLWDAAADLGTIAEYSNGSFGPCHAVRRLTPTAASHTYRVRSYAAATAGSINAGPGGVNQWVPGYLRIRRA